MEIKKISFQDYQEILALTKKNNLDILEEEDWKSLWLDNPYFNEIEKNWTIGWKAVNNNKVVGVVKPSKVIHTVFGGRKENS